MKRIIYSIFLLVFSALVIQGCKDDVDYSSKGADSVKELLIPDDNFDMDLIDNEYSSQMFRWAAPSDGAYTYSVVFYASQNGNEIYRVLADDRGMQSYVDIGHEELIKIAKIAGIEPGESGDIYWNVISSRSFKESQPTAANRRITVNRYARFDDYPVNLFLFGDATETGEDYSEARKFMNYGNGKYEIFTELKGGKEYQLLNRRSSAPEKRVFYADAGGRLLEGDGTITAASDGVFRITANFETAEVIVEAVSNMRYYYAWDHHTANLVYQGGGKWKTDPFVVLLTGDNLDSRYYFRGMIGTVDTKFGHIVEDTQVVSDILDDDYFNIYIYQPYSQWGYTFKFNEEFSNQTIVMHLDLSSDTGQYNHRIDIGDPTPPAVTQLLNPADGATANILSMAGSPLTFDWVAPTSTASLPTRYEVLFFYDKDMQDQYIVQDEGTRDEIPFTSNNNGLDPDFQLPAADLQLMSEKLQTDEDGNLVVYWTVRSNILGYRTLAQDGPNKLIVQPMALPSYVTISGSSQEWDNGTRMKQVGATSEGKFEIYTNLTGGTYYFTDNNNNRYYVNASGDMVTTGTSSASYNGHYRITLDFFTMTATMDKIDRVRFFQCSQNTLIDLNYQGKGVWTMNNQDMVSGDNRYLFRVLTNGASSFNEIWASFNDNNDRGPGEDGFQEDGFWDINPRGPGKDNWEYAFKFYNSRMNGLNVSVTIYMTPDAGNYYHEIIYNSWN